MSLKSSSALKQAAEIPDKLYFRIRDVAKIVQVKPYVLRFWETEFPMVKPEKSSTGHRVYQREDIETLLQIKKLLYQERYSIEGARKRIRELKRQKGIAGDLESFESDAKRAYELATKPISDFFSF